MTEHLASLVRAVNYPSLSDEAKAVAKIVFLDGIANMLAGSREPLGKILANYISLMGGTPTASVVGSGLKTNPPFAAFANAAFCHALDYEPMAWPPNHPTSPVLPALLALAEHERVPGKKVLEALVVGFEVLGRLNLTVDWMKDPYAYFHPPGSLGVVGSATACSKLLDLDPWKIRMAMGIAASRACGLWANTGTMTKAQHSANAARSGVECALLARQGYTSNENFIESEKGGFGQLILGEDADLSAIIRDFGKPYLLVSPGITIKKYPTQTPTHWSIDAALNLKSKHRLQSAKIRSVVVRVGYPNWSAHWPRPKSGLEGKFSIHYTVAIALLDGKVIIDSFTDERRFASDIEEMLEKITVIEDKEIPPSLDYANTWAEVTLRLEGGEALEARCDQPAGRARPLTREERISKFYDCAARVLKKPLADRVAELSERIEKLEDVTELMSLLRSG